MLALLCEYLIKSSLVLSVSIVLVYLMRKKSAGLRHLILSVFFYRAPLFTDSLIFHNRLGNKISSFMANLGYYRSKGRWLSSKLE